MRQIRQNERNIGLYIVLLYQMNMANYIKLQMTYFYSLNNKIDMILIKQTRFTCTAHHSSTFKRVPFDQIPYYIVVYPGQMTKRQC